MTICLFMSMSATVMGIVSIFQIASSSSRFMGVSQ